MKNDIKLIITSTDYKKRLHSTEASVVRGIILQVTTKQRMMNTKFATFYRARNKRRVIKRVSLRV